MIYILKTENENIEIPIIRSKRKTLGLEVKYDGTVKARVPMRASKRIIEGFIQEHESWIIRKRMEWAMRDESHKENSLNDSKILPAVETKEGKQKIRCLIEARVAYYAKMMNVTYYNITMRNQKTRWGSCGSQGNLNFNNRLLFMPEELVDYVVVHELAHRKQMNHSKAFWKVVETYMPDYKERREKLKEYHIDTN